MTWKSGRRLATFTRGDTSASFDYDADGLRTTKTVGTSRVDYYRAGGLLLGEVHTNGSESYTINYMYDESGRMLGFRLDGAEYYYVRDCAGDVTGLINARGELIGSYLYDPWGVLLETYLNTFEEETSEWTDADRAEYMRVLNLNPIRYKSYYYDSETGFYYLQSRYYDPITTRFISPDTVDVLTVSAASITDRNLYAYCDNNPIVRYDDGGEFWHIIVGAAVGAVIGGVSRGLANLADGKSFTDGIAISMVAGAASGALAATGVGVVALAAANAGISMAEEAANQVWDNGGFDGIEFDVQAIAVQGVVGAVTSAIGGGGSGSKQLNSLGKQSVKRVFNSTKSKSVTHILSETKKAFSYYGKNTMKYYKKFAEVTLKYSLPVSVSTSIMSTNRVKRQFERAFG